MKNYSDTVKCPNKRILTAKGKRFLWKCIDIIAAHKSLHRYSKDMQPIKEKFTAIIHDLLIEKGMTIAEVTDLIKSRQFLNQ